MTLLPKSWLETPSGKARSRGLGLPLPGRPGFSNAITDIGNIELGYTTLISGNGPLVPGSGPVRTGVTAILPRGLQDAATPCLAGSYALNGNGEMTGLAWIEEAGELQTPITITNTHSCGVARDATLRWMFERKIGLGQDWGLPVAAETYDGYINDINGFHVTTEHCFNALDNAASGPIELGSVGGGTGMMTYEFKGGCGSASRMVQIGAQTYTLGCFVQSNFGKRDELTVLGVPIGRHISHGTFLDKGLGSIIVIIATDAPLLPNQLKRLARRVPLGLARSGTYGHNGSGDLFLAFSTANKSALAAPSPLRQMQCLAIDALDPLFKAVVESVEEAVLDAMICNDDMTGADDNTLFALPHDRLLELLTERGIAISQKR